MTPPFNRRRPPGTPHKPPTAASSGKMFANKHADILYGLHAVKAALANPVRQISQIWAIDTLVKDVTEWLQLDQPEITIINKSYLDRILPEGAVHQGIAIATKPLDEVFLTDLIIASKTRTRTVLVMLDEVTDPHNIGAVLRSMAAFGAHGMIIHRYNSPGITGTLAKIATGAVEHVPIAAVTNLARSLQELSDAGFLVVGCDERATHAINDLPQSDNIILVLGAEGKGLRPSTREKCSIIATIPTSGPIASLNVSNAAAIALFFLQKTAINH